MRAADQWPQIYAGDPWMNFVYQFDDWRIDGPSRRPRRDRLRPRRLGTLARRQVRKSAAAGVLPPPRQQRGSISPAIFTAESG